MLPHVEDSRFRCVSSRSIGSSGWTDRVMYVVLAKAWSLAFVVLNLAF